MRWQFSIFDTFSNHLKSGVQTLFKLSTDTGKGEVILMMMMFITLVNQANQNQPSALSSAIYLAAPPWRRFTIWFVWVAAIAACPLLINQLTALTWVCIRAYTRIYTYIHTHMLNLFVYARIYNAQQSQSQLTEYWQCLDWALRLSLKAGARPQARA